MTGPNPTRRPSWAALSVAAFLAVIAVVIFWDMGRLSDAAGYSQVGPATIPKWVATGLLVLSACTAWTAFRGNFESEPIRAPGPVLWVVTGLMLQILLLHRTGFTIATGLMFALVARGFGERRWHLSLPVGLALAFFVYVVFARYLRLSLPSGWLEHLFF